MENEHEKRNRVKSISTKILKDEGCLLTDILFFQYNIVTDTVNIYDMLSFQKKRLAYNKICNDFGRKNGRSDEIKNKMRELILKEPTISSGDIRELTGYNLVMISRHYMSLKKECYHL